MNIQEIEADKRIKLSKFNFSCDDIDETIPEPLPRILNFFWLINGRPGSGKTSKILNLLCKRGKMYNKKFDRIFLFSPSLSTMKENPFEELDEDQVYTELNEEIMENVLEVIAESGEKILFVIDDCVNDIKKSPKLQRLMCKILMNRRHLCGYGGSVSVIMTTQVYNKIPAPIRKTASHISVYQTKNKKELETIFDELITIPKQDFFDILNFTFKKRHDFLYLDTNKDHNHMFHRNFNKLVFKNKEENLMK
tara:strand:- start:1069 stop:1821 length:753 start_codon:yes stop_codon:yes gene_type:complete